MPHGLVIGDLVYVPYARAKIIHDGPSVVFRTHVRALVQRKITVDLPNPQQGTVEVASSAVHRNVGVMLFRVGDFESELILTDPLAKSLLQYFRLLLTDDMVRLRDVRSIAELHQFWMMDHQTYTHVVLIGHGRPDAMRFGNDWIGGKQIADAFSIPDVARKHFFSLCCRAGLREFARPFSLGDACASFVAPFHSVHGSLASQFCQTYHAHHLLDGRTIAIAFKRSVEGIPSGASFRMWKRGELQRR